MYQLEELKRIEIIKNFLKEVEEVVSPEVYKKMKGLILEKDDRVKEKFVITWNGNFFKLVNLEKEVHNFFTEFAGLYKGRSENSFANLVVEKKRKETLEAFKKLSEVNKVEETEPEKSSNYKLSKFGFKPESLAQFPHNIEVLAELTKSEEDYELLKKLTSRLDECEKEGEKSNQKLIRLYWQVRDLNKKIRENEKLGEVTTALRTKRGELEKEIESEEENIIREFKKELPKTALLNNVLVKLLQTIRLYYDFLVVETVLGKEKNSLANFSGQLREEDANDYKKLADKFRNALESIEKHLVKKLVKNSNYKVFARELDQNFSRYQKN